MIVQISSDAEQDIADGFWFYEGQAAGLGDYFRSCLITDIESLAFYGGIHEQVAGYHRSLSRRFPFTIYYHVDGDTVNRRADRDRAGLRQHCATSGSAPSHRVDSDT